MKKTETAMIGMPCASGLVPSAMLQSLLQLHKPIPCGFMVVERQRVEKARNALVAEALKGGFDYLFLVDDDNPIPPDALENMIAADKDVVVAPILGRNPDPAGNHHLCAFYSFEHKLGRGKTVRLYEDIGEFREKGPLHRIDAGGTGCMLVKRKVLEKLWKKHEGEPFAFGEVVFEKPITVKGKEFKRRTMSEDVEFCERAVDAGFEIWLDERVRPIHLTRMGAVQWKP